MKIKNFISFIHEVILFFFSQNLRRSLFQFTKYVAHKNKFLQFIKKTILFISLNLVISTFRLYFITLKSKWSNNNKLSTEPVWSLINHTVNIFLSTHISYMKWSINQVSDPLMLCSKSVQEQVTWHNYFWKRLRKLLLLKSILEWWLNSAKDSSIQNMPVSSYSFLVTLCMSNYHSLIFVLLTFLIKSVHLLLLNSFHTNQCSDVQFLCSKNNSLSVLSQSQVLTFIVDLVSMFNFFPKLTI